MSEHPRDRFDLTPDAEAEAAFVDAWGRNRLHHAWLVCGPEGVGKATFAYRAARRLLGAVARPNLGPLGADPRDEVSRLVSAQSHPDLLVLEKLVEGGKTKKSISVDQARELPEFFSMSPSKAAYRVAIVDAADDLNVNAANALLKVLEEPPERGVLFLITHAPGRLLPTIRSRCRRLALPAWPVERLAALAETQGADRDTAAVAASAAGGSPGRLLELLDAETAEYDRLALGWMDGEIGAAETIAMADKFRGVEGAGRFDRLYDRLLAAVKARAVAETGSTAARWAETWSRLSEAPDAVAGLNLDRGEALAVALAEIERARG